jgi:hypothetical protein
VLLLFLPPLLLKTRAQHSPIRTCETDTKQRQVSFLSEEWCVVLARRDFDDFEARLPLKEGVRQF